MTAAEIEAEPHPLEPPPSKVCDDCGTALVGRFCHECGEDNAPPRRELKDLVRDALDNLFSFTEHVIPTLRDLAIDPGRILRGLRDGDTKRYLSPFKLYLSATVVFFLFLGLTGVSFLQVQLIRTGGPVALHVENGSLANDRSNGWRFDERFLYRDSAVPGDPQIVAAIDKSAPLITDEIEQAMVAGFRGLATEPATFNAAFNDWAPRILWVLMPVFALLVWPFYARNTLLADHFIYALWAHTTLFLLLVLGALWNMTGLGSGLTLALLAWQAYLIVGLKGFYGRSWLGAVVKGVVINGVYSLLLLTAFLSLIFWQIAQLLPPSYWTE